MTITEAGRARVRSSEFARGVREAIYGDNAAGVRFEETWQMLVVMAAMALTERDGWFGPALTENERSDFQQFIDKHIDEIEEGVTDAHYKAIEEAIEL